MRQNACAASWIAPVWTGEAWSTRASAAQILSDAFARDGLDVRLNTTVTRVRVERGETLVDLISDDYHSTVAVDAILNGAGRRPNVEGLNLSAAGVDHDPVTGIRVDDLLRTTNRRIYAAGDVAQARRHHTLSVDAVSGVPESAPRDCPDRADSDPVSIREPYRRKPMKRPYTAPNWSQPPRPASRRGGRPREYGSGSNLRRQRSA